MRSWPHRKGAAAQTDEYNQELADMLKTVYPNLRESLSAERGAQQPVEVQQHSSTTGWSLGCCLLRGAACTLKPPLSRVLSC